LKVGSLAVDTGAIAQQPEVASNPVTFLFTYAIHRQDLLGSLPEGLLAGSPGLPSTDRPFKEKLVNFMKGTDEAYLDSVSYHNKIHAADVMMTTHWLFQSVYLQLFLTPFDHLMSLIAAAIHDMGHDGVSNLYHVKSRSSLALRYNDRSVLENFHAALAFGMMRNRKDTDWFSLLSTHFQLDASEKAVDLQAYARKGITEMVLMTDMLKHDFLIRQLKEHVIEILDKKTDEASSDGRRATDLRRRGAELQQPALTEQKYHILPVLLHVADVAGPAKPRPVMLYFTRRLLQEFWAQGDEETRLGLEVSPLCSRAAGMAAVPAGQIGFINFVVMPLFKEVPNVIDEAKEAVDNLAINADFWTKRKQENATYEEIWPPEQVDK